MKLATFQFKLEAIGKNRNPKNKRDYGTIPFFDDQEREQKGGNKITDHCYDRNNIIIGRIGYQYERRKENG